VYIELKQFIMIIERNNDASTARRAPKTVPREFSGDEATM